MMNECVVGGASMSGGWGSGNIVVGAGLGYWHGAKNSGQHSCVFSHRPLTLYALERS